MTVTDLDLGRYKLGWSDEEDYVFKPEKGLNTEIVDEMSAWKGEPEWMRKLRQRSLRTFERKPMAPWFAVNMPDIDFQDIYYYIKPTDHQVDEWDDLPDQMKATYEKLGIPEAERKYLAGVTAQYECLRGRPGAGCCDIERRCGRSRSSIAGDDGLRASIAAATSSTVVGAGRVRERDEADLPDAGGRARDRGHRQPPFLVARRSAEGAVTRWRAVWLPLDEIEVGEPIAVSRVLPDDGTERTLLVAAPTSDRHLERLTFPDETTEELCWLLGLCLGDGQPPSRRSTSVKSRSRCPRTIRSTSRRSRRRIGQFGVESRDA